MKKDNKKNIKYPFSYEAFSGYERYITSRNASYLYDEYLESALVKLELKFSTENLGPINQWDNKDFIKFVVRLFLTEFKKVMKHSFCLSIENEEKSQDHFVKLFCKLNNIVI